MEGTSKGGAEDKGVSVDNQAGAALLTLASLPRETPDGDLRRLVGDVLASDELAGVLPLLVCHMRNHAKSQAGGAGLGEKALVNRLILCIAERDVGLATALVGLLPVYGSWKMSICPVTAENGSKSGHSE